MYFNSFSFAVFLPLVFIAYWWWFRTSKTSQNALLIVASYYFYACWDWRFLFLLLFSTALDFFCAWQIEKNEKPNLRKFWLWLTIGINLGFLGVFKYYDFFATSFATLLQGFGFTVHPFLLQLVLPVGISFYTFHGLSYIIDVYYKRMPAERNPIDYALFVSYFPLLVAGPIERASHLLPQVKEKRTFSYNQGNQGVQLIILGLFKKIVIADNCAFFVNQIFENYSHFSSLELWVGMVFFAFQIYGDFSGYSDIARGVSKLFGIELLMNFNFPYFAKDIADFWRRWHISLSSWFRDYLYIPLGGSKGTKWIQIRNVFVIFLVSGFWHGANWTFIFWGLFHALLFLPLLLLQKNRTNLPSSSYSYAAIPKMILTFLLVCMAWVFFRANSLVDAFGYLTSMFDLRTVSLHYFIKNTKFTLLTSIVLISISYLLFIEWKLLQRKASDMQLSKVTQIALLFLLLFMGAFRNPSTFIYFQF